MHLQAQTIASGKIFSMYSPRIEYKKYNAMKLEDSKISKLGISSQTRQGSSKRHSPSPAFADGIVWITRTREGAVRVYIAESNTGGCIRRSSSAHIADALDEEGGRGQCQERLEDHVTVGLSRQVPGSDIHLV